MNRIENIYIHHYKKLLLIPLAIFLISLGILFYHYQTTGEIINKDVSLQGGVSITVTSDQEFSIANIESSLQQQFPGSDVSARQLSDFSTGKNIGITLEISKVQSPEAKEAVSNVLGIELNEDNFSVEEVGPSLGESFFKEMVFAVLFSLLFMAITVWITFRKFIPSVAVIGSILLELIATLAVLILIDHKLSPAGIAALLMVMGYSIDTDILLTTRVLKRENGTLWHRIVGATKTGLTMTATTIVVSLLMLLTPSEVLREMFTIILIALLVDIVATWVMNSSLLIWYLDISHKKNENKQNN